MKFKSIVITGTCLAMTLNCGTSDQRQTSQNESQVSYLYDGQSNGYGYGYGYGNNYGFYNGQNYNGAALVIGGILIVGAVFIGARAMNQGDNLFTWGNRTYSENSWIAPLRRNGEQAVDTAENAADTATDFFNKKHYYKGLWDLEKIDETTDGMASRMEILSRIANPTGPMDIPFDKADYNKAVANYLRDADRKASFDPAIYLLQDTNVAEAILGELRAMSEMAENMSDTDFKKLLNVSGMPNNTTKQAFIDAKFNDPSDDLYELNPGELWAYVVDSGVFNTGSRTLKADYTDLRNAEVSKVFDNPTADKAELIALYVENIKVQRGFNLHSYDKVLDQFEIYMSKKYKAVRPQVMKGWEDTLGVDFFNRLLNAAAENDVDKYNAIKKELVELFQDPEFRKTIGKSKAKKEAFKGMKKFYRLPNG